MTVNSILFQDQHSHVSIYANEGAHITTSHSETFEEAVENISNSIEAQ